MSAEGITTSMLHTDKQQQFSQLEIVDSKAVMIKGCEHSPAYLTKTCIISVIQSMNSVIKKYIKTKT